jgi:hypothetical protein
LFNLTTGNQVSRRRAADAASRWLRSLRVEYACFDRRQRPVQVSGRCGRLWRFRLSGAEPETPLNPTSIIEVLSPSTEVRISLERWPNARLWSPPGWARVIDAHQRRPLMARTSARKNGLVDVAAILHNILMGP